MSTVYFLKNSQYNRFNYYDVNDSLQMKNERQILTCKGEKLAEQVSNYKELQDIDVLYSSQYVRSISTAKYIASKNNIDINITEKLGERIVGSLEDDYEKFIDFKHKQFKDFDYKLIAGESLNDVKRRMSTFLKTILNKYENKKIAIVTHGTSIIALFSAWCDIEYNCDDDLLLSYNDNVIIDGSVNECSLYKVTFDGLNVKNIEHIEWN